MKFDQTQSSFDHEIFIRNIFTDRKKVMPRNDVDEREWIKQELARLGSDGKGLWTERTYASYRGCSVSTCQKERHLNKELKYFKIWHLVRYHPEDVIKFCFQYRVTP